MYVIKHLLEDFIVEEETIITPLDNGPIRYFWMIKRDYTTEKALTLVANHLHISEKDIGFCGNKDRKAVTKQLLSIPSSTPFRPLLSDRLLLQHFGYGKDRLRLGQLARNKFIITVRNLETVPPIISKPILNLFGPQRFSEHNVAIGKLLSKHNYKEALPLLKEQNHRETTLAEERLLKNPQDIVGALRSYRKLTLQFYVHAYQSCLWNEAAQKLSNSSRETLSIPGFGSDFDVEELSAYAHLLEREGIVLRDFVHKSFPDINSEGGSRLLFVVPQDLQIMNTKADTQFKDKKECTISFSLPPGSYATVVIDAYFKSNYPLL